MTYNACVLVQELLCKLPKSVHLKRMNEEIINGYKPWMNEMDNLQLSAISLSLYFIPCL